MYLKFTLFALSIFAFFRLITWLTKNILSKRNIKKTIIFILPIVELYIWIGYIIWASRTFFTDNIIYLVVTISLIIISVFFLSWYILKDFFIGIIVKSQNKLEKNQIIKFQDYKGSIIKIGYLSLDIETEDNEFVTIPYSVLKSETIIKTNPSKSLKKFLINISTTNKKPFTQIKEDIKNLIMNAPWSSVNKLPIFHNCIEKDNFYKFEIYVYTLCKGHSEKLEKYLKENL